MNRNGYRRGSIIVVRFGRGYGYRVGTYIRKALLRIVLQLRFFMIKRSDNIVYLSVIDKALLRLGGYRRRLLFVFAGGKPEQRAYACKYEQCGYGYPEMPFHSFPPIFLPLCAALFFKFA